MPGGGAGGSETTPGGGTGSAGSVTGSLPLAGRIGRVDVERRRRTSGGAGRLELGHDLCHAPGSATGDDVKRLLVVERLDVTLFTGLQARLRASPSFALGLSSPVRVIWATTIGLAPVM